MFYYAVARHGTAGLGRSHGYARVEEYETGGTWRSDQTTTVAGPFSIRTEAQGIADGWESECQRYEESALNIIYDDA